MAAQSFVTVAAGTNVRVPPRLGLPPSS